MNNTPSFAEALSEMNLSEIDSLWNGFATRITYAAQTLAETQRRITRHKRAGYQVPEHLTKRAEEQRAALAEARTEEEPFRVEWERRGGWTQYVLSVSGRGRVHRRGCHTQHPLMTLVTFLPEMSGMGPQEVFERIGSKACTLCVRKGWTSPASVPGHHREGQRFLVGWDATVKCPGTGHYGRRRGRSPYARCPQCGRAVTVTETGLLRAHKPGAVGEGQAGQAVRD